MHLSSSTYTKVSVVPCHPSDKKTSTFSIKDLRKNTFTICNVRRQKPRDPTNVSKSFYKRTTLTGVLHRRIRKVCQLFLFMRLRSRLAWTRKWRQMCYICHTNAHLATCPVQKLNFGQSVRVAKMSRSFLPECRKSSYASSGLLQWFREC